MVPKIYFLAELYLQPILGKTLLYRFKSKTNDFSKNKWGEEKINTRSVDITYLGKIKDLFAFDIFTWKVIFTRNGLAVEEQLLSKKFLAFKVIQLGVNNNGEIEKIYNLSELQHEWEIERSELSETFEGDEFEFYINEITEMLESEEKTIRYLKSRNMFGIYFHGLFGKYNPQEIPIKRKIKNLDFTVTEVIEEIWPDNRISGFSIRAEKDIDTQNEMQEYQGQWTYDELSKLIEANLKMESKKKNINYSAIWVG